MVFLFGFTINSRLQLGREFTTKDFHVGFHEDVLVGAWDHPNLHPAANEFAPAEIIRERTEHRLTSRAQQDHRAVVAFVHVLHQRLQVNLPKPQLLLREMGGIDHLFQVHLGRAPRVP